MGNLLMGPRLTRAEIEARDRKQDREALAFIQSHYECGWLIQPDWRCPRCLRVTRLIRCPKCGQRPVNGQVYWFNGCWIEFTTFVSEIDRRNRQFETTGHYDDEPINKISM